MTTEFLDPKRKLVDEVADWLCGTGAYAGRGRIRSTPEGAQSLDHVMVVVPTAQSGRNLRLAVARRFRDCGVIPPRVVQPMRLVVPADDSLREATPCEIAAAFQQFVKAGRDKMLKLDCLVRSEEFEDLTARFALLDQLEDIWRALAGNGLLMRDVVPLAGERLAAEFGDEQRRWEQLSELEAGFFDYLHARGLIYPTERVHAAKTAAEIVDSAVEEIVVPALADPIRILKDVLGQQEQAGKRLTVLFHAEEAECGRFNEWGAPRTERWIGGERPSLPQLKDADIIAAVNVSALSKMVAEDFPRADGGAALPALALCDEELFNGVAAAFLNRGYVVHNPERNLLVRSSLGRMLKHLMALYASEILPWKEFVAVFRNDDVMSALGLSEKSREQALAGLDVAQNAYIPTEVPWGASFPEDPNLRKHDRENLSAFCEAADKLMRIVRERRDGVSLAVFLRRMLQWAFAERSLAAGAVGKEFQAAADAARDFLNALEGEFVASLPISAAEFTALARRELEAAVYSLEPEAADAVLTEGWLELAWSPAERIALVGLHEGKVPDSIVGHPFLPDSLRSALGLVSNADRLARDSWLLQELLISHAPHAVRAYVARTDDAGDICRPSRLLYLCTDDELSVRIQGLFGDLPEERRDKQRRTDWKLRLPDEVKRVDHYSPSSLDTYVKCPFTYLLKNGLGMKPYLDKQELGADDFGTLVHAALEEYAKIQIVRKDDQLTDADEIRRLFAEEICPKIRAKYGRTTLNIELQLQSIEGRLARFAERQAEWAQAGWRIRKTEAEVPESLEIPGLGFRIHGFIDRVDENINPDVAKPWCIIDYKTWDQTGLTGKVFTANRKSEQQMRHLAFAKTLGLPTYYAGKSKTGEPNQRILSVQLPVYGMALSAMEPGVPFAMVDYRYFILGGVEDQCVLVPLGERDVEASVATAKRAVELIEQNVFWPPGPTDEWEWDFRGLFVVDPVSDLGESEWVQAQRRKLEGRHD